MMNNAQAELGVILDLMHKWCVRYGEDYLTAFITHNYGSAHISVDSPLHYERCIEKNYETSPNGWTRY